MQGRSGIGREKEVGGNVGGERTKDPRFRGGWRHAYICSCLNWAVIWEKRDGPDHDTAMSVQQTASFSPHLGLH